MNTTENLEKKAIDTFRAGFNCAQAVLTAYAHDLNLDENLAKSISCGFGGGMGRLQETCGAVTGSFMALGIINSGRYADDRVRKEETYAMIRKFSDKFREIHGSLDCKSLIKCDLKTEEGQAFFKDQKLSETVCEGCISDSIRIAEKLIQNAP